MKKNFQLDQTTDDADKDVKMRKTRSLVKWAAIIMAAAVFCMFGVAVQGLDYPGQKVVEPRADIITIDTMKTFGKLERPAVSFYHTRHTEALAEKRKDCQTCHVKKDERLSVKFKRIEDTDRKSVMNVYHLNCISCHTELTAANEKSGPVECGECHVQRPVASNRLAMTFNKSLHYRHAVAADNKCEKCHHEYDAKAKKIFYAKGKEGSCRYCHKEESEENRISMRLASHQDCIACHLGAVAEKRKAGPVDCLGCHAPEKRQMIKRVADVPRMKRNQPDVAYVISTPDEVKIGQPASLITRMAPVPFNHKAHEKSNDTCVVCHHADLATCGSCHTQTGDKKGKNVTLEQAMHQPSSRQSCVGCHELNQEDPRCAGCHAPIGEVRKKNEATCKACHMAPPPEMPATSDDAAANMIAARLIESRAAVPAVFTPEEIPEKVVIKRLSNTYEAVDMPHRKIVKALVENIAENDIARYFHMEQGTVCQGCHHNSPVSKKPPRCGSCHGKPFDEKDIFKPGLMAAYHRQCLQCHDTMGIAKPDSRDCTACHIKKKVW